MLPLAQALQQRAGIDEPLAVAGALATRCSKHAGEASAELQALLDRAAAMQDRSSWFSHTPVQVLKIEREKQQAAQQAWLAEFHPTEGAKYPDRSANLRSSRSLQDDDVDWSPAAAGSCGRGHAGCSRLEGSCCSSAESGWDASCSVRYPEDGYVGEMYEAVGDVGDAACSTQVEEQQGGLHMSSQQEKEQAGSVTAAVAAECAAARAAAAAAAAARNAPAAPWWQADALLAQRVSQLLQPSQRQASYCCSATLEVYDALLAANADRAAQLLAAGEMRGEVLLQQLQTPEQLHAAWVSQLRGRSAAQRLQQVLAEAAGVH